MKYKDDTFRYLHEEMKNLHTAGDITAAELKEFEQECFKGSPSAAPADRTVHAPAMAASPEPQGH
ncbi:hypothetical protein AGMMS49940_06880 [Spirochaetia bacterium]|nr:hypothetical protein AGMMS49940_06880 [Spirochaetia bacterium]